MNHEYKDLKQIKGKLRSIIYLHASLKLQELTILLYEDLLKKQIKAKLRSHVYFHASFNFRLPIIIMNHEYKDLKQILIKREN